MTVTTPLPVCEGSDTTSGFRDPVRDAAIAFRNILKAMSTPGTIVEMDCCPSAGLPPAALGVALTLFDADTTVWISPALAAGIDMLRFHCGCPITETPDTAAFTLAPGLEMVDIFPQLDPGTPDYPDRSTTAIILVDALSATHGATLSGPGIEGSRPLSLGQDDTLWPLLRQNNASFPLGIDTILVTGTRLAAIPRSTRIALESEG